MCQDGGVSTLVTGEAVELSVQPAALAARALTCLIDDTLARLEIAS